MDTKRFQRRRENFACGHCGEVVRGSGYTNHCPRCLWSRHNDINPGDRAAHCGGLMQPTGVERKNGVTKILHRCVSCGFERKNKISENDSTEALLQLG